MPTIVRYVNFFLCRRFDIYPTYPPTPLTYLAASQNLTFVVSLHTLHAFSQSTQTPGTQSTKGELMHAFTSTCPMQRNKVVPAQVQLDTNMWKTGQVSSGMSMEVSSRVPS